MHKHLELEEMLALNPHIDKQLLEQSREQLQKLREMGLKKKGYELARPHTRRPGKDWGTWNRILPPLPRKEG